MAFCKKCGKENKDFSKFCTGCGNIMSAQTNPVFIGEDKPGKEAVHDQIICINCGTQNKENAKFCIKCGTSLLITVKPAELQGLTSHKEEKLSEAVNLIETNSTLVDDIKQDVIPVTPLQKNEANVNDAELTDIAKEDVLVNTANIQLPAPITEEESEEQVLPQIEKDQNDVIGNDPVVDKIAKVHNIIDDDYQEAPKKNRKKVILWTIGILLVTGLGAFFILGYFFNTHGDDGIRNEKEVSNLPPASALAATDSVNNSTRAADTNTSKINDPVASSSTIPLNERDSVIVDTMNEIKSPGDLKKNSVITEAPDSIKNNEQSSFNYLSIRQIKNDLINLKKSVCEDFEYTGSQSLIINAGLPKIINQKKLDLYGIVRVTITLKDETNNKTCTAELYYKKDKKEFSLETASEK